MRQISFALTTSQIANRTKTVTRRLGWRFLKVGDQLQPIVKGQGIRKGFKVEKIGGPIRVVGLSTEMMSQFEYRADAVDECRREGFPDLTPWQFCQFFVSTHQKVFGRPVDLEVTRIEFEYVEQQAQS